MKKTAKLTFVLPSLLACTLTALNLHAQDAASPSANSPSANSPSTNSPSTNSPSSAPSSSAPFYHPFTIGPEIGTTGYGGTGTFRFADHFGVTGGFDYFHYTENGNIKNVNYDAQLRLQSEPVGLCLYPSADSSFHLNLGVVFNQFRLTGTNPNGTFTLNGNTYAGTLNLNVQQQPISPYLTIAGNFFYFDHGHHVSIGGELGAMYTGTPRVGLISSNPAANNDVATERQELIKYANYGKIWPIVKLGLNVSF